MPFINPRGIMFATRAGIAAVAGGCFLLLLAAASIADTPSTAPATRAYTFGIVPQHKASDLAERWVPLLQYLSARTGLTLEFRTARDIPTFERQLLLGEHDFAYMNPFHYVMLQQKAGYRVLARERERALRGIIVVRADANHKHLRDLEGQTLAFPAPAAFAASLVTRAHLRAEGIRVTPRFVVSHDSVYHGVANGLFVAGGGIPETLEKLDPIVRSQLRVLWTSTEYAPHAFAVHRGVPAEVVTTVRQAMLEIGLNPEGARRLEAAGLRNLTSANDGEYEQIRRLAPSIRAEICATAEPENGSSWLCPTSFADSETRVSLSPKTHHP